MIQMSFLIVFYVLDFATFRMNSLPLKERLYSSEPYNIK